MRKGNTEQRLGIVVDLAQNIGALLEKLGCSIGTGDLQVHSPIDGSRIGAVATANAGDIDAAAAQSQIAFLQWRSVPAPRRGELVRLFGNALRAHKHDLARLVTIDCGKPLSEGLGEVQEMIDICDFAVGLSRQLHGLTIASERPGHRMMEQWHPLGPVLIISAFNFPVAVWAWNAALALVCGNSVIWKPSEKTPLTAIAVQAIFEQAVAAFGDAPLNLSQVLHGGRDTGAALLPTRALRWSPQPGARTWAERSGKWPPHALPRLSLSLVETTQRLSVKRRTLRWRCVECCFRRLERAVKDAPAYAAFSCKTRFTIASLLH